MNRRKCQRKGHRWVQPVGCPVPIWFCSRWFCGVDSWQVEGIPAELSGGDQ